MNNKLAKLTLIISFVAIISLSSGCSNMNYHTHISSKFDELIKKDKKTLIIEARTRRDKFRYGKALGTVVFPVYFPLVLPDGFQLESTKAEFAKPNLKNMRSLDGTTGNLIVHYRSGENTLTVYEGDIKMDDSDVALIDKHIQLGNDKPYAYYQKRASGYEYIGWRESFNNEPIGFKEPKFNVGDGGQYALYNNSITYLIKAKGVDYDQLVGMAKSMTIYDDTWTDTNQNEGLGMWQTAKVPWDNKKYQDWQNYLPGK